MTPVIPCNPLDAKLDIVGTSVRRSDVAEKVSGSARYTADLRLPGMLFARLKRSTVAHAHIRRIDTRRALALPGVKAVLTHEDVPRVLHFGSPHPRAASCTKDQFILDHKVRHWGEGVAAVAAVSEEIAEEALSLIDVEYDELPVMTTTEAAEAPGAVQIHGDRSDVLPGNLVVPPVRVARGDIERGFAEADVIVEGEYEGGRPSPAYMEPNACLCHWDEHGKLTVHISTQTAFMVRGALAEVLGLPLNHVRVLVDHFGGGFGAKQDL
ncbi:MAG: molybdopterin-dependent oxidoreductase, partial [Rubrivivax sp.]|nr:molybdopterin-dependent oxidoreductase [Rubrivivax sp.]